MPINPYGLQTAAQYFPAQQPNMQGNLLSGLNLGLKLAMMKKQNLLDEEARKREEAEYTQAQEDRKNKIITDVFETNMSLVNRDKDKFPESLNAAVKKTREQINKLLGDEPLPMRSELMMDMMDEIASKGDLEFLRTQYFEPKYGGEKKYVNLKPGEKTIEITPEGAKEIATGGEKKEWKKGDLRHYQQGDQVVYEEWDGEKWVYKNKGAKFKDTGEGAEEKKKEKNKTEIRRQIKSLWGINEFSTMDPETSRKVEEATVLAQKLFESGVDLDMAVYTANVQTRRKYGSEEPAAQYPNTEGKDASKMTDEELDKIIKGKL